jgi:hypothetical protein
LSIATYSVVANTLFRANWKISLADAGWRASFEIETTMRRTPVGINWEGNLCNRRR